MQGEDEVLSFLVETLQGYVKQPAPVITASTTIDEIGLESFDLIEFLFKVEDQYGIEIEHNANNMASETTTIGDIARTIRTLGLKTEAG